MTISKIAWRLLCFTLVLSACSKHKEQSCESSEAASTNISLDSLAKASNWPKELSITLFTGPDLTPSPACLAVAPTGEVFVGVDMMGSLGKEPGKGKIVKLVDCNNDGVVDSHTVFATPDNPRGILPIGDKVYVLHTTFSQFKATGMDLVVYEDLNRDGVADGPSKPLIQNISSPKFLQSRGTDHSTNGIRMGIDGWIYIAVGDFGFHGAVDRDGKKMTMLGGGILRVRPDGTETEIYTHGLRNIYDVAIDPFMNIYTRGNTNDGGGWNIRFIHQIQSGEYGYPVLFKHFTDEILPALVDVGGGSGTGALFMDDSTWPKKYNNVPIMADWGRSQLFIHRLTEDGASFKQADEKFIKLSQISDLDVDASGRMFMAAWDGAGYRGNPDKGFVVRAVPKQWDYKPFPVVSELSVHGLVEYMKSGSGVARLHAQQELITRKDGATALLEIAEDKSLSLASRVAAVFGYAQAAGSSSIESLVKLTDDPSIKEWVLRALTDRKRQAVNVPLEPFIEALKSSDDRLRIAAMVGLGRMEDLDAAEALLKTEVPTSAVAPAKDIEGPHATPNSEIIPAHIAVRSLVSLNAVEACIDAIGTESSDLALWALRYMHDSKAVDGMLKAYDATEDKDLQKQIVSTLARLLHKEAPYDGSWWWSTRPDTHGPYYKTARWKASDKIEGFLRKIWQKSSRSDKQMFADLNGKLRMGIIDFGGEEKTELARVKAPEVDLNKIKNKKGQIGKSSIEDIMLSLDDIKGNAVLGEQLFTRQGCVACHSLKASEPMKGPFMGQIGSIMSKEQIAESILKPNASISQGFSSVMITANNGKVYSGFVTGESSGVVKMRNIIGQEFTIREADIKERKELESSMMPIGLANSMSYEEFASLVAFLSKQK
jgi:putative heme-binding domain-containing protein